MQTDEASPVPLADPSAASPTVRVLLDALDAVAPLHLAETWDNVGLLVGDPARAVTRALLCIDLTPAVADEARQLGCDAVVAYHPPLFAAKKRFVAGDASFEAARDGVALLSPHTALDVAEGGTNDVLGDLVGMVERAPLRAAAVAEAIKLVTFVPAQQLEPLSRALFDAGAGVIGNYRACSFRVEGKGTFFGEEGANPAVGAAGRLETVDETRLEVVLPAARARDVVAALRRHHPYEEPAFDLVRLAPPPGGPGIGRVGRVEPVARAALVERVKQGLGVDRVLVAGPLEGSVDRVAVCAGSGEGLLADALAARAQAYVTGELKHHDALAAARAGVTVICALHSNSERVALQRLRDRLAAALPSVAFAISRRDADPFTLR